MDIGNEFHEFELANASLCLFHVSECVAVVRSRNPHPPRIVQLEP